METTRTIRDNHNKTQMKQSNVSKGIRRLFRNKYNIAGGLILLFFLFLAVFAPVIAPYPPNQVKPGASLQAPSMEHLFGTDRLGRDIFSRVIHGSTISLQVSIGTVGFALFFGSTLGLIAGYAGGSLGDTIMRFMDALWSLPSIILALAIGTILGPGTRNVILAVGITFTPAFSRIIYSEVLSIKEELYIRAAKSLGASHIRIMFSDILPNCMASLIVYTTLMAGQAVIIEASLSFLGVGVVQPQAAWGSILRSGYSYVRVAPWHSIFPGLAIFLIVLGFNFLGDGLRDAMDVKLGENKVGK